MSKKAERIEMLERRIEQLYRTINSRTLKEWHYRTGLESLESLQKTLFLNERILTLLKNDLPVYFFKSDAMFTVGFGNYISNSVATA